jgi:hypothetical protein
MIIYEQSMSVNKSMRDLLKSLGFLQLHIPRRREPSSNLAGFFSTNSPKIARENLSFFNITLEFLLLLHLILQHLSTRLLKQNKFRNQLLLTTLRFISAIALENVDLYRIFSRNNKWAFLPILPKSNKYVWRFLLIGDESCVFYHIRHYSLTLSKWQCSRSGKIGGNILKAIVMIFWNIIGRYRYIINQLPDDDSFDAMHFINNTLISIEKLPDLHAANQTKYLFSIWTKYRYIGCSFLIRTLRTRAKLDRNCNTKI